MQLQWAVMSLSCGSSDPVSVPASSRLVSAISGGQCDSQGFEEFFGHNLNARQIHSTFPVGRDYSPDGIIHLQGVL